MLSVLRELLWLSFMELLPQQARIIWPDMSVLFYLTSRIQVSERFPTQEFAAIGFIALFSLD